MSDPIAIEYRAFISYSHADTRWAKWLHKRLENFVIDKELHGRETTTGKVPKTLHPVFRDRNDFQTGHSLTDQTLAALDASGALIVLCSPASAKSEYVNEEIRLFKTRHPQRPIVPLILQGKPDDPDHGCFAPALQFQLAADGSISDQSSGVIASDIRETGDGRELALAKVVAGVLGLPPDDIFRRAERARRQRLRRWIAGLSGILVILLGLLVYAELNRHLANKRYQLAAAAAIDLVIVQSTLSLAARNEPLISERDLTMGFLKNLDNTKIRDAIYQRVKIEKYGIECLKVQRLVELSEPNSIQRARLFDSFYRDRLRNRRLRDIISSMWRQAADILKQRHLISCGRDPEVAAPNTYTYLLDQTLDLMSRQ